MQIKKMKKLVLNVLLVLSLVLSLVACGGNSSSTSNSGATTTKKEAIKIAIPDDATNGGRAIKLLEKAGLIEVDPSVGYTPELKDVTKYIYNIEIIPQAANTLVATLDDYAAATINGTYAIPAGLIPSKDALIVEKQGTESDNPYVNIIVAKSADKNNENYKKIVSAYQTQKVAEYILGAYKEAFIPSFDYEEVDENQLQATVKEINSYKSSKDGKTIVKVGVCGANNDQWKAVQKVLDDENASIYIELQEYDAYTIPNEALNAGDCDLNAFQHKAFLKNEVEKQGYKIESIADTLIAPLSLYSKKVSSIDDLKNLAGLK